MHHLLLQEYRKKHYIPTIQIKKYVIYSSIKFFFFFLSAMRRLKSRIASTRGFLNATNCFVASLTAFASVKCGFVPAATSLSVEAALYASRRWWARNSDRAS